MSASKGGTVPRLFSRFVRLCCVGAALLLAQPVQAQAQDSLPFFKNYFVTGDYVVRGTSVWRKGVNGKAIVEIPALGLPVANDAEFVPPTADIVAAFLYVQTAEKIQGSGIDHAKFAGYDLGPFTAAGSTVPGSGTIAKALNWDQATIPCWTVLYPGGGRRLVTYRADVLRFLPIDSNTGKQVVDKKLILQIPDSGIEFGDDDESAREPSNKYGPRAVGASIVVVYRDRAKAYKGISLYDGGFTKRAYATMDQTVKGFYQAAATDPQARMTHIVGDGRPFLSEVAKINGVPTVNPFRSANGPKWDNWTTPVTLGANASEVKVRVEPNTLLSDCVSWSAMVASTKVQDSDGDGLLDVWETSGGLVDPNGQALPNLSGIADPAVKDIFVEIDYMGVDAETSYGGVVEQPHSHRPTPAALKIAAEAFGKKGIKVHFDVGPGYPASDADPYVIRGRGGDAVSEMDTVCTRSAQESPSVCQFSRYPGTVGWKTGFGFLKAKFFDANRKDIFRYAFFAHFVGIPKDACQKDDGHGNLISDPACEVKDPSTGDSIRAGFNTAVTNSGIGDFPGADFMVTLGGFKNSEGKPVGSDFMQASTMAHEMGHTFEFTHAGPPQIPREPNCKPNYLSVMNYLFQLRGLLDAKGKPQVDFSGEALALVPELGLTDPGPLTQLSYRTGWYAPLATSYLKFTAPAATKHCNGSDLLKAADGTLSEVPMVRVDALSLAGGEIDWNADGLENLAGAARDGSQDINFNGSTEALNAGVDDWSHIRLNELGGRRNVGGFYIDLQGRKAVGPLSLDVGRGDIGRGDIGRGDIGRGDIGRGDIGRGDIGRGDIGRGDIGRGDIGRGDIGRGDFGGGDLDVGAPYERAIGELDFETFTAATGNAPTPPNTLQACLTQRTDGDGEAYQCAGEGGNLPVRVSWEAPNVGRAVAYRVYRFSVLSEAPFPPASLPAEPIAIIGSVEGGGLPTTYYDFDAPRGETLAYYVTAEFDDGSVSGISNFDTVTTPLPRIFMQDLGTAAPAGMLGGQAMTPFAADTQGLLATTVLAPGGGSLGFGGADLAHRTVNGQGFPDGWRTWSHGYAGDVYYQPASSLTMTLPAGTTAFYFYAEPREFATFSFTITTTGGGTFVTTGEVPIVGNSGARGFGFYTSETTIASITVTMLTVPVAFPGFAVGEFGVARIP